MRLTYKMFDKLYQHYKDDFDLEMKMKATRTSYQKLKAEMYKSEEWF